MKNCPVCKLEVEDLCTGLCPNQDCTWEFEFVGVEPTPEIMKRYEEKLDRAKKNFNALLNLKKNVLDDTDNFQGNEENHNFTIENDLNKCSFLSSGSKNKYFPGSHIIGLL